MLHKKWFLYKNNCNLFIDGLLKGQFSAFRNHSACQKNEFRFLPRVSAQQMLSAKAKSISFNYLERLCIGLRCTLQEILGVYSTGALPIPPDAPLFGWVGYELPFPLADFRHLTPDQLAKASAFLKDLIVEG